MIQPLHPADLRGVITGGTNAMRALQQRLARGSGDVTLELYQLADVATGDALRARGLRDTVAVLGDARLALGGRGDDLVAATAAGTHWRTWGDGDRALWQHAKTFHFDDGTGGAPETWISNLAPIPDTHNRTELTLVVGGDAAAAARDVTRATLQGSGRGIGVAGAIDAAAGHGILVNDPLAGRRHLADGIAQLVGDGQGELLVVTKGIENAAMTEQIVAAHGAGRDVRVLVRDIAAADAQLLDDAGVPTFVLSNGLKPRINGVFSADRGIVGSAFLWDNMLGGAGTMTSRDIGVALAGSQADAVRAAALDSVAGMRHTPLRDAIRGGHLPQHI